MFLPLRDVTCPSTTEARRWQRCTMAFSRVSNGVPEFVSTLPYDLEVWEGKSVTRTTEDCEKWHPNRERVGEISERFWMPLERWFSIFEDMLMVNWQQSENGYCNVMSIIYVDSMIYIYIYIIIRRPFLEWYSTVCQLFLLKLKQVGTVFCQFCAYEFSRQASCYFQHVHCITLKAWVFFTFFHSTWKLGQPCTKCHRHCRIPLKAEGIVKSLGVEGWSDCWSCCWFRMIDL